MARILFYIGAATIFVSELLAAFEVLDVTYAKGWTFIGFLLMLPAAFKLSFTDKL